MANIESKVDKNAKIAVLCGGMSSEAEVSRRSGKGCYSALQRLGYKNAELVEVDKDIANKLKDGHYDYAYNALHGKYGEDGCIQGILEILKIPYLPVKIYRLQNLHLFKKGIILKKKLQI